MGDPTQNKINHVCVVLDASTSMAARASELIKVADNLIAYLAQRSQEMNQETRITVHVFSDPTNVKCVIWDMDVLRLPSIATLYRADGWTALVDGTMLAINDLKLITEKYGDHAFLIYVLTDGAENRSRQRPATLLSTINALPGHWTVAALVPDAMCMFEAKQFGFPAQNVAVWDATTNRGVTEVGNVMRDSAERFMRGRERGQRGTKALFSTDLDTVNADSIADAGLTPLPGNAYTLTHVTQRTQIRPWVEDVLRAHYRLGSGFYELVKRERIQRTKEIAILDRRTGVVYMGDGARGLLNLPDMDVRVAPDHNPQYKIFVQSTSVNRVLPEYTDLLLIPGAAR